MTQENDEASKTQKAKSPGARRAAKQVAMSRELSQYTGLPAWEGMRRDGKASTFIDSIVGAQYVYDDMPKKTQKVIDLLREQFPIYRPDAYAEQQAEQRETSANERSTDKDDFK